MRIMMVAMIMMMMVIKIVMIRMMMMRTMMIQEIIETGKVLIAVMIDIIMMSQNPHFYKRH